MSVALRKRYPLHFLEFLAKASELALSSREYHQWAHAKLMHGMTVDADEDLNATQCMLLLKDEMNCR